MKSIHQVTKCLRRTATMFGCLLLLALPLVLGVTGCEYNEDAGPDIVVSFFATVSPDSRETTFGAAMIGAAQATSEDINKQIRPDGGKVLIVTSITGYHITPSNKTPFSVVDLMGITKAGSTRGWGNGGLSIAGLHTTHVTFKPGLAVTLKSNESLCIASFIQSNDKARVGVHGYLRDRQ